MSWNRTVTCSYCYKEGHNRRGCEKLKQWCKDNPDSWQAENFKRSKESASRRSCSYCSEEGHNKRSCQPRKEDIIVASKVNIEWRKRILENMKKDGIGIGALVTSEQSDQNSLEMVIGIEWNEINFTAYHNAHDCQFLIVKSVKKINEAYTFLRGLSGKFLDGAKEPWNPIGRVLSPMSEQAIDAQVPIDFFTNHEDIINKHVERTYDSPQQLASILNEKFFEEKEK